jgi:hypothetical protein
MSRKNEKRLMEQWLERNENDTGPLHVNAFIKSENI